MYSKRSQTINLLTFLIIEKRGSFMEKILQVDNLHVSFLTNERVFEAVKGVSFEVHKGETLGVVGESGSGKCVTARSIMQLLHSPPSLMTEGIIDFSGKTISTYTYREMKAIRGQDISMILQDPMTSLNPSIKIGEQHDEELRRHQKHSAIHSKNHSIQMLQHVGIKNAGDRSS